MITENKTRLSWKTKVILVCIIFLISFGAYSYFWYQGVIKRDLQSRGYIADSQAYAVVLEKINQEKERCQVLITQKEGVFSDFEYCKGFIAWSDEYSLKQ